MTEAELDLIADALAPVLNELEDGSELVSNRVKLLEERTVAFSEFQSAVMAGSYAIRGDKGIDGENGLNGIDGKSVTVDEVAPLIEVEVRKAVAEMQPTAVTVGVDAASIKELRDAISAISRGLEDVRMTVNVAVQAAVDAAVAKAISAIPVPKDGQNGRDADASAVELLVSAHVQRAVASLPAPVDGKSVTVEDVAPLIEAQVHKAVSAIPPAAAPVGVKGVLIDRAGHLVVTLTDGSTHDAGEVVGKDGRDIVMADVEKCIAAEVAKIPAPKDGRNGKDGLGFDDFEVVFTEKGVFHRFTRGDVVKDFRLPTPVYLGVFKAGTTYDQGDMVTWGGSLWTAMEKTGAKPGEAGKDSRAWLLTVQRGRDGKTGEKGGPGERGPKGDPGPQGRSY